MREAGERARALYISLSLRSPSPVSMHMVYGL